MRVITKVLSFVGTVGGMELHRSCCGATTESDCTKLMIADDSCGHDKEKTLEAAQCRGVKTDNAEACKEHCCKAKDDGVLGVGGISGPPQEPPAQGPAQPAPPAVVTAGATQGDVVHQPVDVNPVVPQEGAASVPQQADDEDADEGSAEIQAAYEEALDTTLKTKQEGRFSEFPVVFDVTEDTEKLFGLYMAIQGDPNGQPKSKEDLIRLWGKWQSWTATYLDQSIRDALTDAFPNSIDFSRPKDGSMIRRGFSLEEMQRLRAAWANVHGRSQLGRTRSEPEKLNDLKLQFTKLVNAM